MNQAMLNAGTSMLAAGISGGGAAVTVWHNGYACPLKATVLHMSQVVDEVNGGLIEGEWVAIHIVSAELKFNGTVTEPRQGMTLAWEGSTYEVARPGGDRKHFDYLGTSKTMLAMYAKRVS